MPAMPNQYTRGKAGSLAARSDAAAGNGAGDGKASADATAPTAITPANVLNNTAPPSAAISCGVPPRNTTANTPSAIPTIAKRRCGLALRAIVPWVTLSAEPAATPDSAWSTASSAYPVALDASQNVSAEIAKPALAT